MKKLLCVMALMCIGILLVSCGSNHLGDPKAQLMRDFGLHIEKKDCVLEELFNNYEGFPYDCRDRLAVCNPLSHSLRRASSPRRGIFLAFL